MTTPTFTTKHYKAIAASINWLEGLKVGPTASRQKPSKMPNAYVMGAEDYIPNIYLFRIAKQLAHDFQIDNPRFDEAKFLKACGFSGKSAGKPASLGHALKLSGKFVESK